MGGNLLTLNKRETQSLKMNNQSVKLHCLHGEQWHSMGGTGAVTTGAKF